MAASRPLDTLTGREILALLMPNHEWELHSMHSASWGAGMLRIVCSCGADAYFDAAEVKEITWCDVGDVVRRLRKLTYMDRRAA